MKLIAHLKRLRIEIYLLIGGSLVAVLCSLAVIQWLRPDLIRAAVPADLRVVRESLEVPPFYNLAIPKLALDVQVDQLLNDPIVGVRNVPLEPSRMARGPHDVLGFRNESVPNKIDILIVGDSQTYGNNVIANESWPAIVKAALPGVTVYQAAVGGWSGPQYAEAVTRLLPFYPNVVVVAFYMGNDAAEAFRASRNFNAFSGYRLNSALTTDDLPSYPFPPPTADAWRVPITAGDGVKHEVSFTPKLRWVSNDLSSESIREGNAILRSSMRRIVSVTAKIGAQVLFVLIPTKESAFEKLLLQRNIDLREDYKALVDAELISRASLISFVDELAKLPELKSKTPAGIDCTAALQNRILIDPLKSYPLNWDGHPLAAGYSAIASCVTAALPKIVYPPDGLYRSGRGEEPVLYLIQDRKLYLLASTQAARTRGFDPKLATPLPKSVGLSPAISAVFH